MSHVAQYWSSWLQDNKERKHTLVAQHVCFQMHDKGFRTEVLLRFEFYFRNKLPLSQNYVTSEGVVSPNVLLYQHHSIARYKVLNTNIIIFRVLLQNVSGAFNTVDTNSRNDGGFSKA